MTNPISDPLREAAQAVLDCWDSRNWKAAPTADYMRRLRAALAAAPQSAPAPAADERAAMIEAIEAAVDGTELVDGEPWGSDTIADALLADGWTRGGDAAGLREALSPEDREWINNRADELFRQSERQRGGVRPATITPMDYRDYFVIDATAERIAALARLSAPETLAWAVVGEDGSLIGINYDRKTAQHLCNPCESVVRVAIRVVEAGA